MQRFPFTIFGRATLILTVLTVVTFATLPVDAAERCIRIQRQGNIETLVNVCNVCRVASLIRSRPGNAVPVGREFNVQARSTFPVPFRGPGRTRVNNEKACPGDPGAAQNLLQTENQEEPAAQQQCVGMERSEKLGVVVINRCGTCRAVAIQRMTADGRGGERDYMLIAGGARMPVAPKGFAQVGLLGDIACDLPSQ